MFADLFSNFAGLHQGIQAALAQAVRGTAEDWTVWPRAIGFAVALGAIHALTPGHGKAVIASFFLGHTMPVRATWTTGLKVAVGHVGLAVLLIAVFGAAVTSFGRPAGAAAVVQTFAHGVIALSGLWLLARHLFGRKGAGTDVVPALPALIPCPLTMLVFSFALGRGDLPTALVIVALLGLGIALTLSGLALAASVLRRTVMVAYQPHPESIARLSARMEILSAGAIAVIGLWLLAADLR